MKLILIGATVAMIHPANPSPAHERMALNLSQYAYAVAVRTRCPDQLSERAFNELRYRLARRGLTPGWLAANPYAVGSAQDAVESRVQSLGGDEAFCEAVKEGHI